jgi:hypothetical protein
MHDFQIGDRVLARRREGFLSSYLNPFIGTVKYVSSNEAEIIAVDCQCGQNYMNVSYDDMCRFGFGESGYAGHMHVISLKDLCPIAKDISNAKIEALKALF